MGEDKHYPYSYYYDDDGPYEIMLNLPIIQMTLMIWSDTTLRGALCLVKQNCSKIAQKEQENSSYDVSGSNAVL